jgi:hypothetical protein
MSAGARRKTHVNPKGSGMSMPNVANNSVVRLPPSISALERVKQEIASHHARVLKTMNGNAEEWVNASLDLCAALIEARRLKPPRMRQSDWLKQEDLYIYNAADLNALFRLGTNLALARTILTETKSRSYQLIWREVGDRFERPRAKPSMPPPMPSMPPMPSKVPKPPKPPSFTEIHTAMQLGDEAMAKIRGTSLDTAAEKRELIMLNRGAAPRTLTPIVQQLVDDAAAGKIVSAIASAARLNKRTKTRPSLEAAWKKRMPFAWEQATYEEQEAFIDYLMHHMKVKGAP